MADAEFRQPPRAGMAPARIRRSPPPARPSLPANFLAQAVPAQEGGPTGDVPAAAAAVAEAPPVETAAALPLPGPVIARTIERIGYSCGKVASSSAVEGGVYKVTCTSGASYQATPEIAAGVEGDACQPGREFRFPAEAADLFDQGAADVLGNVVRVRARPGQLPREPVDPVVVAAQQGLERVPASGEDGVDKVNIRIAAEIAHPSQPRCACRPECTSRANKEGPPASAAWRS